MSALRDFDDSYYAADRDHSAAMDDAANQSDREIRDWLADTVRDETRRQLNEQCAVDGSIARGAWHDFEREFGPTDAGSFVAICEENNTCVWEDAYETVMAETIEAAGDQ